MPSLALTATRLKRSFQSSLLPLTLSLQDGNTALIVAAREGNTGIVRQLLLSGAKVDQADKVSNKNTKYQYQFVHNIHVLCTSRNI